MNGACSEEGRRESSAKIEPKQKSTDISSEGGAHRLTNMTHRAEYISVLFMFFHDQPQHHTREPLFMYTDATTVTRMSRVFCGKIFHLNYSLQTSSKQNFFKARLLSGYKEIIVC